MSVRKFGVALLFALVQVISPIGCSGLRAQLPRYGMYSVHLSKISNEPEQGVSYLGLTTKQVYVGFDYNVSAANLFSGSIGWVHVDRNGHAAFVPLIVGFEGGQRGAATVGSMYLTERSLVELKFSDGFGSERDRFYGKADLYPLDLLFLNIGPAAETREAWGSKPTTDLGFGTRFQISGGPLKGLLVDYRQTWRMTGPGRIPESRLVLSAFSL